MSIPPKQRRELTQRYVEIIHQLGQLPIAGRPLRNHLHVNGVDYWAASTLRESSPWGSPVFARLDQLRGVRTAQEDERESGAADARHTNMRTMLYWLVNFAYSVIRRPRRIRGDVMFVVFLPESPLPVSDHEIARRYYGQLIDHVVSMGLQPVVVFLPTNSRPAAMSRGERGTWRTMRNTLGSVPITSYMASTSARQAWKNWRSLQRSAPSARKVMNAVAGDSTLRALWPMCAGDYTNSVWGTASARTALLAAAFKNLLHHADDVQLVVYPFEGQGWESLLESACAEKGVNSIGYLHTIMKPWDMRAHTALREVPPRTLALHGTYDREELEVGDTQTEFVEALRYAYLGEASSHQHRSTNTGEHQLLIVMGSDCANSQQQYVALRQAIARTSKQWRVVVKPHPQCAFVDDGNFSTHITTGSLQEALSQSDAVFLCGTAAPLDSYLFGLPTAALSDASGYSMNPLEPNEAYFVGESVDAVVEWLVAVIGRPPKRPDAAYFFDLAPSCAKWEAVIRKHLRPTS